MNIPDDMVEFILRWKAKGRRYDFNKLVDCFDGFFTAFVLYNLLYNLLCARNKTEYPYKGDEECATKIARKFLGAAAIAEDAEIITNALAIKELVESGTFYIRESVWDTTTVEKLRSNDPEQWSKGILEIVYKIRCNTFHGQKSFQESQRNILIPCIKILQRLNDMIIEKLDPNQRFQSTRSPQRVLQG